ncbi:hypothetical protein ElyMa_003016200 [Elysia marginata]|uniref:Uncharacterized protein n=1 Tax=Elysia marginata TaxID=1093978 RepID=A0AAV4III0_9GAST|nr:hypothetical protein ElyMa_003016200 [Elysia marginata]
MYLLSLKLKHEQPHTSTPTATSDLLIPGAECFHEISTPRRYIKRQRDTQNVEGDGDVRYSKCSVYDVKPPPQFQYHGAPRIAWISIGFCPHHSYRKH